MNDILKWKILPDDMENFSSIIELEKHGSRTYIRGKEGCRWYKEEKYIMPT